MQMIQRYISNNIFYIFQGATWGLLVWFHRKVWFPLDNFLYEFIDIPALIYIFIVFFLSLMLYIFWKKIREHLKFGILASLILLFIYNPLVLQPFYIYFFIITCLYFFDRKNIKQGIFLASICVFIISGIQKINPFFFTEVIPFLVPDVPHIMVLFVGGGIVAAEVIVPILLYKYPHKQLFQILFHLLNVGILYIAFTDSNIHISVALWVILLWFSVVVTLPRARITIQRIQRYIIVFLMIIPGFLGYFGIIPAYTTFKIYSGNTNLAYLQIDGQSNKILELWFFQEYSLYPLPYTPLYKKMLPYFCNSLVFDTPVVSMKIVEKEKWLWKENLITEFRCGNQ